MGFYLNKELSLIPAHSNNLINTITMSATVEKVTNERDKGGHDPDLELYPNLSELDHGKCETEEATPAPATTDEPAQTTAPAAAASDDKPAAEKKPAKKWCSIL